MDRTKGANNVTVGGKRRFTDGPPGTTVNADFLNALQEEIMSCIEGAGITPDSNNWAQLKQAIQNTVLTNGFFMPAIGISQGSGALGDFTSSGNVTMDGEYHYNNFYLQSAHSITVGSTGILIIRCKVSCTINGNIKGNGTSGDGTYNGGPGAGGGGGGGSNALIGGSGANVYSAGAAAYGGGGGGKINPLMIQLFKGIPGGAGGSGTVSGATGGGNTSYVANTEWAICRLLDAGVFPMGAGGGGGSGQAGRGGGGGGGGHFVLVVAPVIFGTGSINCSGGNGGDGEYSVTCGGGGGGGGGVALTVSGPTPTLTLTVTGGPGGTGKDTGYVYGSPGTNGFAKMYHT